MWTWSMRLHALLDCHILPGFDDGILRGGGGYIQQGETTSSKVEVNASMEGVSTTLYPVQKLQIAIKVTLNEYHELKSTP